MENKEIELYSEDIREILGLIPKWITRWGLSLIFIIILLFIAFSYLIEYPDIIEGNIKIHLSEVPLPLSANIDGYIEDIYKENNSSIRQGEIIAVINSDTKLKHYSLIKDVLSNLSSSKDYTKCICPSIDSIGKLQVFYDRFRQNILEYKQYLKLSVNQSKVNDLKEQINTIESVIEKLNEQKNIQKDKLQLAQQNKTRFSELHQIGNISTQKLEAIQNEYLTVLYNIKQTESKINEYLLEVEKLKGNVNQSSLNDDIQSFNLLKGINHSLTILKSEIHSWENKYLIKSPINGILSIPSHINIYTYIKSGEEIATVINNQNPTLVGQITVPTYGIGKVKLGQTVEIVIDEYPVQDFGKVQEQIEDIDLIARKKQYSILTSIQYPIVTSYHDTIPFTPNMHGKASIMTEDKRLIERIFNHLQFLVNNN
ncbi:MAG: hypothetical protein R3E32_25040 [Chitinophagales bacterium]